MAGWGSAVGKIFDWLPGRKESKEKEIERLLSENEKIQSQSPISSSNADRFERNLARIKQLRSDLTKIN